MLLGCLEYLTHKRGHIDYETWKEAKIPSNVTAVDFVDFRKKYCMPYTFELLVPSPDERTCFPRQIGVTVSEFLLKGA